MGRIANAWNALRGAPVPRRRAFAAAGAGRLRASFSGSSLSADESIVRSLQKMRDRSRALANDNEYMRRFLQQCATHIVGPQGVGFQNRSKDRTGQLDTADNDLIEEGWRQFSKRGNFEVTGQMGRAAVERLIVQQVARDGEILIRKRPGYDRSASKYALQLLDPDLLDHRLNVDPGQGGVRIRAGVELDSDGWPIAYHLLRKHPGENVNLAGDFGQRHVRVSSEQIMHLFVPFRAGQNRGVPWAHAAILALHDMGAYRQSAMIAARVGADKVGFFTGDEYPGDENDDGQVIMPSEAGEFGWLPEGTDLHQWNPTYPHDQFETFTKSMLRGISGGLGVAYNGFANDLEGVNFSSIRAGVLEERDSWMVLQNWLIESFHDQLFPEWLGFQLLRGSLGTIPFSRLDAKNAPSWQPKRWQWVDPLKDAQANKAAHDLRVKSRSQIIRELGHDPDDVWREIRAENETLESLGIMPAEESPALAASIGGSDDDD